MKSTSIILLCAICASNLFAQLEKMTIHQAAAGEIILTLNGDAGDYNILKSTDLSKWNFLQKIEIPIEGTKSLNVYEYNETAAFFRAFPQTVTALAFNEDPQQPEAMLIETINEAIIVCGDKNELGQVTQITQIVHSYDGTDAGSAFININEEGLPVRIYTDGIEIAFHAWSDNKVSLTLIENGESEFLGQVVLEKALTDKLRELNSGVQSQTAEEEFFIFSPDSTTKRIKPAGALAMSAHLTISVTRTAIAATKLSTPLVGWFLFSISAAAIISETIAMSGNETAVDVANFLGVVACATGDYYSCGTFLTSKTFELLQQSPPPVSNLYVFTVVILETENGALFVNEDPAAGMQSVRRGKVGETEEVVFSVVVNIEESGTSIVIDGINHTVSGDGTILNVSAHDQTGVSVIEEASNDDVIFSEFFTLSGSGTYNMMTRELIITYDDYSHLLWNLSGATSVSRVRERWTGTPLVTQQD